MAAYSKKLIVFAFDGTLTRDDTPVDPALADALMKLLAVKQVAVISGAPYARFETHLLKSLPVAADKLSNLFLLPTSGTRMYGWRGSWTEQYAEHLSPPEKEKIQSTLNIALKTVGWSKPASSYGQIIEDRGSQITFSALGQRAPLELKRAWDPGREKRARIIDILCAKAPEFEARIAGNTSIDITRRGMNKGYGIRKLEERLKLPLDEILFVGDALYHGGNDYPAKAAGVDCVSVAGPEETLSLIRSWLS